MKFLAASKRSVPLSKAKNVCACKIDCPLPLPPLRGTATAVKLTASGLMDFIPLNPQELS